MIGRAWRSLGWFVTGLAVALGLLLVPLRVAAERKELDRTAGEIADTQRDLRALDTEFDTRANMAQLEKWNGDTLRMAAPTAAQFVPDEAALASIDVRQGGGAVQMASLVVPADPGSVTAPAIAAVSVPAAATAVQPAPAAPRQPVVTAAVAARAPVRAPPPALHLASAAVEPPHAALAATAPHMQKVALLDRKLLSDSTLGDLLSGARAENGTLR